MFWILQIIGWAIPTTINVWAKLSANTELNSKYIILEGLVFYLSGILCSSLLRLFIKKNISIVRFRKSDILKLVSGLLVSSALFTALMFLLAIPAYNLWHDKVFELSRLLIFVSFINTFILLFVWLALYLIIKTRTRIRLERIKRVELKTELKEAQLNTLKGQINPHFMFNSLNNIRGLMLEDVNKARDMITRLSEILRYSLNKDKIDTIALSEELEMVNNYIALSKIQLDDRLQFNSEIQASLLKHKIPTMIIQMLIENAVKHGIANQQKGGTIRLNVNEVDNKVHIQVINTGQLKQHSQSTKLGLDNIQKRLKLLYKNQASFNIVQQDDEVVATICLPIL